MASNVGAAGQTGLVEALEEEVVLEHVVEVVETTGKEDNPEQAEGRQEECQQAEPGQPGSTGTVSQRAQKALEALQALQLELEPINTEARWAYSRLRRNQEKKRKTHLDRRRAAIQGIPKFWVKAIVNHPQLSTMISEEDEDMLSYVLNLKVEKLIHSKKCNITFFFGCNPYFQNNMIVKEYSITITGYAASYSTPIHWLQGYEHEADSRRHHDTSLNFFNWFTGHCCQGYIKVAEIIIDDLWLDPLKYYQKEKGTSGEK